MNESEVAASGFVAAGGDRTEIKELAEVVFDFVALTVEAAPAARFHATMAWQVGKGIVVLTPSAASASRAEFPS